MRSLVSHIGSFRPHRMVSGLRVAMISGDNARTADAVAGRLGIERVLVEVQPSLRGHVQAVEPC